MFFIRYTTNSQADLERGYSFAGYTMFDSEEEAIEEFSLYGDEEFVAPDNVTPLWGRRLSGLCGFGPFGTIEEAQSALNNGEYAENYRSEDAPGTIFEGEESWDAEMDGADDEGVRFTPLAVVA